MEGSSDRNGRSPGQDLRRRRSEVSRQAIRDAVTDLLRDTHPATLSIPAVAGAAGVSVRTVYRYFPTKQDLLDDVAEIQQRRADAMVNGRQDLYSNPDRYLEALWTDFENDLPAVKAQHQSQLGSEIRRSRLGQTRPGLDERIDRTFPDATDADRADLADLVVLLTSSSAFLELHTRLDRSGPDAARLVWWAVRALQKQFTADGGLGYSSRTPDRAGAPTTTAAPADRQPTDQQPTDPIAGQSTRPATTESEQP
ncbi:MAG: TetR/AcrR family transcriptional regulator [Actinomycetota bacterium]